MGNYTKKINGVPAFSGTKAIHLGINGIIFFDIIGSYCTIFFLSDSPDLEHREPIDKSYADYGYKFATPIYDAFASHGEERIPHLEVGYHNSLLSNEPKPLKRGAIFVDLDAVVYEFNEVIKPTHNGLPLYSVKMESFEVQDTNDDHYTKQILIAIYAGDKSKRSEADSPSEA